MRRESNQEIRDLDSYKLINKYFEKHKRKVGIRPLKMYIERSEGITINLKRIARIKRKYGLITEKRKKSKISVGVYKALEHNTCENLLKQNFKVSKPDEVYSTDVTYFKNKNGIKAYLSAVKDLCTKEISGYKVSRINDIELVIGSIENSIKEADGALLHSDQGFQYTSNVYQNYLRRKGIVQSMSRRGNCLDNAPIESFFGHMKDEIDCKNWENIEELNKRIRKYIKFYNEDRPQWSLKRKTPVEYRSFLS